MDAWTDRTDGWMDGWTDGQIYGHMDGQTDGWMGGWTDGRMNRWTEGPSIHPFILPAKSLRARAAVDVELSKRCFQATRTVKCAKMAKKVPLRFRQNAWAAGHAPAHAETPARKVGTPPGTFSD